MQISHFILAYVIQISTDLLSILFFFNLFLILITVHYLGGDIWSKSLALFLDEVLQEYLKAIDACNLF